MRFEDLPIIFDDEEVKDGWRRRIKRTGTVAELLETWDIDDPDELTETAQVLRHLRREMEEPPPTKTVVDCEEAFRRMPPAVKDLMQALGAELMKHQTTIDIDR